MNVGSSDGNIVPSPVVSSGSDPFSRISQVMNRLSASSREVEKRPGGGSCTRKMPEPNQKKEVDISNIPSSAVTAWLEEDVRESETEPDPRRLVSARVSSADSCDAHDQWSEGVDGVRKQRPTQKGTVTISGWLNKTRRNDSKIKWTLKRLESAKTTRRWFELDVLPHGAMLTWYDKEDGQAKGKQSLVGASVTTTKFATFVLRYKSGRRDKLQAKDQVEADLWVQAVRSAGKIGNSNSELLHDKEFVERDTDLLQFDSRPFYEVKKVNRFGKAKKRFMRIEDGKLCSYNHLDRMHKAVDISTLRMHKAVDISTLLRIEKSVADQHSLLITGEDDVPQSYICTSMEKRESFHAALYTAWRAEQVIRASVGSNMRKRSGHITVQCATWNVGNSMPPTDLHKWLLRDDEEHDIYAIGTQECTYALSGERKNLKCHEDWVKLVSAHFTADGSYELLGEREYWEMKLLVFLKEGLRKHVSNVQWNSKGTGIGDTLGNKGAIAVSFQVYDLGLCFVTAHHEAMQAEVEGRNMDFGNIVDKMNLGNKDIDLLSQFDHCFWFGDLNYRLDLPMEECKKRIEKKQWKWLLDYDQLKTEMVAGRAFGSFREGEIKYKPTYRYLRGGRKYDEAKSRIPSWCDRVLWRSLPGHATKRDIKQLSLYAADEITTSDHSPVASAFRIRYHRNFLPNITSHSAEATDEPTRKTTRIVFDELSVRPGSALAPYHFRKPTRLTLRFYGRYMPEAETDYHPSTEYACAHWPSEKIPQLHTLLGEMERPRDALGRSVVTIALTDRCGNSDSSTRKHLGYAVLSLKCACKNLGMFVDFSLPLTHRGVSCGFLSGAVAIQDMPDDPEDINDPEDDEINAYRASYQRREEFDSDSLSDDDGCVARDTTMTEDYLNDSDDGRESDDDGFFTGGATTAENNPDDSDDDHENVSVSDLFPETSRLEDFHNTHYKSDETELKRESR